MMMMIPDMREVRAVVSEKDARSAMRGAGGDCVETRCKFVSFYHLVVLCSTNHN